MVGDLFGARSRSVADPDRFDPDCCRFRPLNTPICARHAVKIGNSPVGIGNSPVGFGNTPVGIGNTPVGFGNSPVGFGNTVCPAQPGPARHGLYLLIWGTRAVLFWNRLPGPD